MYGVLISADMQHLVTMHIDTWYTLDPGLQNQSYIGTVVRDVVMDKYIGRVLL